jgi:lactate 2-monooxygenase
LAMCPTGGGLVIVYGGVGRVQTYPGRAHGGRQANGGLAAIDCLAEVAGAVPDVPVLFDSGVRSGSDVVKALALGATSAGIGRPYIYGAALAGTDGIVHVLKTVLAEADLLMAVDGYPAIADLSHDSIRRCTT